MELIHPARFLFNAGSTPKAWNEQMLADPCLRVEWYEADSGRVFPGTDIKGGVAVTYRDAKRKPGPIGTFIADDTLRDIKQKVCSGKGFHSLEESIQTAEADHCTETLYVEHPE